MALIFQVRNDVPGALCCGAEVGRVTAVMHLQGHLASVGDQDSFVRGQKKCGGRLQLARILKDPVWRSCPARFAVIGKRRQRYIGQNSPLTC